MLANLGVPWVILGHSERRALLGESKEVWSRLHLMQHVSRVICIVVVNACTFPFGTMFPLRYIWLLTYCGGPVFTPWPLPSKECSHLMVLLFCLDASLLETRLLMPCLRDWRSLHALVRPLSRGRLGQPWKLLLHKQKQLLVLFIYFQSSDCVVSFYALHVDWLYSSASTISSHAWNFNIIYNRSYTSFGEHFSSGEFCFVLFMIKIRSWRWVWLDNLHV